MKLLLAIIIIIFFNCEDNLSSSDNGNPNQDDGCGELEYECSDGAIVCDLSDCPDTDIPGCLDFSACNYNPGANVDDGLCEYPEENYDCDGSYAITINSTGTSHLIVFLDTIQGLEPGDEIGIFDLNGVLETVDAGEEAEYGEVLVGMVIWNEEANEQGTIASCSAIISEDLSDFGGPVLNGAVDGNDVVLRVYDISANIEYNTSPSFENGGQFGDVFTTVTSLEIER